MGQAKRRIGHQGVPGAYSDLAATSFFAGMDYEKKAFPYFEDVVVAVMDGTIDYGVLPIENSSTGGITDVYDLIRKYHAYIVGEKIVKVMTKSGNWLGNGWRNGWRLGRRGSDDWIG